MPRTWLVMLVCLLAGCSADGAGSSAWRMFNPWTPTELADDPSFRAKVNKDSFPSAPASVRASASS